MFGLEKKPKAPFEFALEEELKTDPNKKKVLLAEVETATQEIKSILKQGTDAQNFDDYGILLHGYSALQKVLNKISTKK
ncbi:MAG: DUF5398 family protein [Verrucomicrobia bacterium]|nr:DUF5398 family protein [Verrucomicrobiota bacterium]